MLKRLKDLREEHNLTQSELAKILGMARSNISKYENGDLDPNIETLKKYSSYFNCSIDYILGCTNNKKEIIPKNDDYTAIVVKAKNAEIPAKALNDYIEFLQGQTRKKN